MPDVFQHKFCQITWIKKQLFELKQSTNSFIQQD